MNGWATPPDAFASGCPVAHPTCSDILPQPFRHASGENGWLASLPLARRLALAHGGDIDAAEHRVAVIDAAQTAGPRRVRRARFKTIAHRAGRVSFE